MWVVRQDAAVRGASLRTIVDTAVRHRGGSKDKALDAGGRQGRRSQVGACRHLPRYSPVGRSLVLVLVGLLGCAIVPHSLPLHAANESVLTAARVCTELDWREKGGFERAAAYRAAVQRFKDLYVRVAAGDRSSEAFEQQLAERLDELEAAYHWSRDICRLRRQLKHEDGGCGTTSLSPREFVTILETIVLDEDAGWVKRDPALAEALRLDD